MRVVVAAIAALALLCSAAPVMAQSGAVPPSTHGSALVYDSEYPFIDYSGQPAHNDVARLSARLQRGEIKLEFRTPRGYLDSLLQALRIDPSSQTLVFSKTSLQASAITPTTPRAIYFNDDTYVAFVANTGVIEISTMDSALGAVFYTMDNRNPASVHVERETLRCLVCHDTFSLGGGGVPSFLFLSAYGRQAGELLTKTVAVPTTDETALTDRWGGWYVTGDSGGLKHLGNILPSDAGVRLDRIRYATPERVEGLESVQPYPTDKSDIVALLVFEHQVYIHNLIVHANFKSRMLLEKDSPGGSTTARQWSALQDVTRSRMTALLEPLVRAMLFVNAAGLPTHVRSGSGFDRWFESRGPRDSRGRSLRDLDLNTRVFKYPLSFLIYTEGFDDLPAPAKEYVYRRLAQVLTGQDTSGEFCAIQPADRAASLEILVATKPEFASFYRAFNTRS